jgi:hypothetical protein
MEVYLSIIPSDGTDVIVKLSGNNPIVIESTNKIETSMLSNLVEATLEGKLFMHSGINYVCIYNIIKYKSQFVGNKPQIDKLKILNVVLTKLLEYTELSLSNDKYVIGIAVTGNDEEELINIMNTLPYKGIIKKFGSICNIEERLFRAYKKDMADIYELVDFKTKEHCGVACVNKLETSLMMTNAFEQKKNTSLANIEDSDDEDNEELKYVNVWCKKDKNGWIPVSIKTKATISGTIEY